MEKWFTGVHERNAKSKLQNLERRVKNCCIYYARDVRDVRPRSCEAANRGSGCLFNLVDLLGSLYTWVTPWQKLLIWIPRLLGNDVSISPVVHTILWVHAVINYLRFRRERWFTGVHERNAKSKLQKLQSEEDVSIYQKLGKQYFEAITWNNKRCMNMGWDDGIYPTLP